MIQVNDSTSSANILRIMPSSLNYLISHLRYQRPSDIQYLSSTTIYHNSCQKQLFTRNQAPTFPLLSKIPAINNSPTSTFASSDFLTASITINLSSTNSLLTTSDQLSCYQQPSITSPQNLRHQQVFISIFASSDFYQYFIQRRV